MKHTGRYNAVGNLFWVNFTWRSSKHVWTNLKSVRELQATHFAKGPAPLPWKVVVAVSSKGMTAAALEKEYGNLKRVSPEEAEAALLLAVAQRIKDGAKTSELNMWRKTMLTIEMEFRYLPTPDDIWFAAVNQRRSLIVDYEAMVRSAMQQVQEILEFKARKEASSGKTFSNKVLAEMWNNEALQISSKYCEPIVEDWVEAAVKAQRHILSDKDLRLLVQWLEEEYGKKSPLNSVYALEGITTACRSRDDVKWVLETMQDHLRQGCTVGDFSQRAFLGHKKQKGSIQVILFKKALLEYLHPWLISHGFSDEHVAVLQSLNDHQKYRALCGGPGKRVDTSWQATKRESTRKMINFIGQVVFQRDMDQYIKTALKVSTDPKEVIAAVGHLKESLDEVTAAFKLECGPKPPPSTLEAAQSSAVEEADFEVPLTELVSKEQLELDKDGDLPRWQEFLEETYDKWVKLILNDSSSTTLAEEMNLNRIALCF